MEFNINITLSPHADGNRIGVAFDGDGGMPVSVIVQGISMFLDGLEKMQAKHDTPSTIGQLYPEGGEG